MSIDQSAKNASSAARPRHAGFLVRALAAILDLGVPAYLIVSLFFEFDWLLGGSQGQSSTWAQVINAVVWTAATVLLLVNWDGRTPGKKLTRIRIVTYPGYGPLGYGKATVRSLIGLLSAAPFMLGYAAISIMVAGRKDKRGYHDMIASTCVVHDE